MDPFKSLKIPPNFTLQKSFQLEEIIKQTLENFVSQEQQKKSSQPSETARPVDHNSIILTSLILEWTSEAVDKYKNLGDACDWKVLCALVSAFVEGEQQALGLVRDLINRLHTYREPEKVKPDVEEEDLNIEKEIRVARERVEASLKQKSQSKPIPPVPSKPHPIPERPSRPQPSKSFSSSSGGGGKRKFDSFDPSQKVPSPMQDVLRKRAVDYARDYFYHFSSNAK
jgi:hypothetical protein